MVYIEIFSALRVFYANFPFQRTKRKVKAAKRAENGYRRVKHIDLFKGQGKLKYFRFHDNHYYILNVFIIGLFLDNLFMFN